jgi:ribosomal protein S18 acetylase RimI-like enzyme
MLDLAYFPNFFPPAEQPYVQTIELREADRTIATARWHTAGGAEGVAQLLDLIVVPEHRRKGHGSTLITAFKEQAAAYGQATGVVTRRLWVSVEQKTQVNARAFLTRHGFHHVATIHELLAHQDALVYLLALD